MQTITTKIQSSFNSTQVCKQCLESQSQCKFNTNKIQLEIQKLLPGFEIFLTNFSKFFSNSKFNLLYAENKFRICYKSTLENELQSKNVQVVPKYQFKYQSFKHERGKSEFEIIFKFQ